jgi:hypothetical protein
MVFELLSRLRRAPERLSRRSGLGHRGDRHHPRQQPPAATAATLRGQPRNPAGIAAGLALAVRPAGSAETPLGLVVLRVRRAWD